jgi:hypothetical protein
MMQFRTIKAAIVELLEKNSQQLFTVVDYQTQRKAAQDDALSLGSVTVYYLSGDFPKTSASIQSKTHHVATFRLELTVTSSAQVDLSILNNASAGAAEYAAALANLQEAGSKADDVFDELVENVYQILMDPVNVDLGLAKGILADRWIEQVQKDQPEPRGELLVLTGSMFLKLRTEETFTGLPAAALGSLQDVTIDQEGDDNEKTGVQVNL